MKTKKREKDNKKDSKYDSIKGLLKTLDMI